MGKVEQIRGTGTPSLVHTKEAGFEWSAAVGACHTAYAQERAVVSTVRLYFWLAAA